MPKGKFALIAGLWLLTAAHAQQSPDAAFRVTVNSVQVDAVVTDREGRHVTDLKLEDFEVLQDGKPQRLNFASYIQVGRNAPPGQRPPLGPVAPEKLDRQKVERTIAIVVDDLGLSFENVGPVQAALRTFIDTQIQPGDLVAVLRTGSNIGALQQYTTDKRKLHAAVDRIQWNFQSRTGLSAGGVPSTMAVGGDYAPISGAAAGGSAIDSIRRLSFIAGAMRLLPGRKSMVLFAETNVVPLTVAGLRDTDAAPAVQRAIEQMLDVSSRASVGIYCIDTRGLLLGLTDPAQEGMRYLSQATGALAFGSLSNDLSVPLAMVLDDQKGYYLLGYTPETLSFDLESGKRKFHTITIRTNRPGLSVRSHAGFIGAEGTERPAPAPGSTDAVVASLASPFGSPEIQVGMTCLFFNAAKGGSSITTLVNFKGGDLSFREGAGGLREAAGDIAVMVYGDNGGVAYRTATTIRARLTEAQYKLALENGFLYRFQLPIKKPGPYDVRVAVRDAASRKVGTASQFVNVPELKKERLALSGLLLQVPLPVGPAAAGAPDLRGGTALRIFHPGETLTYSYQVLNPKRGRGKQGPQVESQVRLYRDGKLLFTGKKTPVEVGSDPQRLPAGGDLKIGPEMPAGQYVLEAAVTDTLAARGSATLTQYIDFRVSP